MLCSFCREPWYMVNARTGGLIVLTDKGYKPKAPEGKAPLTILQTMRQREVNKTLTPESPPEWEKGKSEFIDPSARWRDEAKAEKQKQEKQEKENQK